MNSFSVKLTSLLSLGILSLLLVLTGRFTSPAIASKKADKKILENLTLNDLDEYSLRVKQQRPGQENTGNTENQAVLLSEIGTLDSNDKKLGDNSLFDLHKFESDTEQEVIINLESSDFDAYLVLLDEDSNSISENDDSEASNTNSSISIRLSKDKVYYVLVNSYDASGEGEYQLTIARSGGENSLSLTGSNQSSENSNTERLREEAAEVFNTLDIIRQSFQEFDELWQKVQDLWDKKLYSEAYEQAQLIEEKIMRVQDDLVELQVQLQGESLRTLDLGQANIQITQAIIQVENLSRLLPLITNFSKFSAEVEDFRLIAIELQDSIKKESYSEVYERARLAQKELEDLSEEIKIFQSNTEDIASRNVEGFEGIDFFSITSGLAKVSDNVSDAQEVFIFLEILSKVFLDTETLSLTYTEWQQHNKTEDYQASLASVNIMEENIAQLTETFDSLQFQSQVILEDNDPLKIFNHDADSYLSQIADAQEEIKVYSQIIPLLRPLASAQINSEEISALYDRAARRYNKGYFQEALELLQSSRSKALDLELNLNNDFELILEGLESSENPKTIEFLSTFAESKAEIISVINTIKAVAPLIHGVQNYYSNNLVGSIEPWIQAKRDFEEANNYQGLGASLRALGNVYTWLSDYEKSIESFSQAIDISRSDDDKKSEFYSLSGLVHVYHSLGVYTKALELSEEAQRIAAELEDQELELEANRNISRVLISLRQYDEALDLLQQTLPVYRSLEAKTYEMDILDAISRAYYGAKDYERAQYFANQSLEIARFLSHSVGESAALKMLGDIHSKENNFTEGLESYHQAFPIFRETEVRIGEAATVASMGELLYKLEKPEMAIVFLKYAVNIRESIRDDIQELPLDIQSSFLESYADEYRLLSNILLEQDRVLEAQQVLDLLKVQEFEDYLRGVRGNGVTAAGLDYWPAEQKVLDLYNRTLTANQTFETFLNSSELVSLSEQLRRNAQGQNLNPATLNSLQDNLEQLDNAALLYPLILEDRLELLLVTPNGLSRKTVAIDRIELNRLITRFRSEILDPSSNPESLAQQLYEWLIQPIESELEKTQTLLYAADGQLRYIPLSALHDGEQWLTQKFTINHITAASLTDFSETGQTNLDVLAGAFTEGSYSYQVGDRNFNFAGLPFAGVEVENISKEIPTTTAYFNQQFSPDAVLPQMNDNSIVHFATHATFVTGAPDDSFIVFGNGERVTLREIGSWELPNVDLVVLSACETAVSGSLGNGEEILGFGYQIQRTGARAAIASLWQVSDNGTQILMNAFYTALKNGYSEADALRRAQTALVTNDFTVVEGERASLTVEFKESLLAQTNGQPSHPYYWASFILIGNGL